FIGIFFLAMPFPLIVIAAGLIGFIVARQDPKLLGLSAEPHIVKPGGWERWRQGATRGPTGPCVWGAAGGPRLVRFGQHLRLVVIGTFFSKLAVVSFGGAYALLAYMAQQVVETNHWLTAAEMVDGLGLAETTPGPLILVTQFVGFLAAYREATPLSPFVAGVLGAAM